MPTDPCLRGDPILRRLPRGPAVVVEVGIFAATLSCYLLAKHKFLRLIAVDNWAPVDEQPASYRETGDRHAMQTAEECTIFRLNAERKLAKYQDRVTLLPMNSIDAAKRVRDRSVDLVFLDGDHSEPGVAADIEAWDRKIKSGGWLSGHDYGHRSGAFTGVTLAVNKWAVDMKIERDSDTTWFCRR